jgi:hypothetical protein
MSEDQCALLTELGIVLVVIEVRVGIDDDPYWPIRNLANRGQNLRIENREVIIHQQQSVRPFLYFDVSAGTRDHVDVAGNSPDDFGDLRSLLHIIDLDVESAFVRYRAARGNLPLGCSKTGDGG